MLDVWRAQSEAAWAQAEASKLCQVLVSADENPVDRPVVSNGNRDKFGKLRTNVGGRPKTDPRRLRGLAGRRAQSSRRLPGEIPKRFELRAHEQFQIVQHMKELQKTFPSTMAGRLGFWRAARRDFPKITRKRMAQLIKDETKIQERIDRLGLGAHSAGAVSSNKPGRQVAAYTRKSVASGSRSEGASRLWRDRTGGEDLA